MSVQSWQYKKISKDEASARLREIQSLFKKQVERITDLQEQISAAEKVIFSCLSEQRALQEVLGQ